MEDVVELILVRHGQTAWNAARRFLGRTDVPLDEVGRAQAASLRGLPLLQGLAAVYASPLSRALETARAFHHDPVPVPGLEELHQGCLEGLDGPTAFERYASFFQAWQRDPTGVCCPEGESLDACRDRALAVLHRLAETHAPQGRVAVVTHQMVIASVCCTVAGQSLAAWHAWGVPNTGWRRLAWRDGAWSLFDEATGP